MNYCYLKLFAGAQDFSEEEGHIMQFLIGIVPPEELSLLVNQLREKWDYDATEPHITLKSPVGLDDINDWIDGVEEVIHHFTSFSVSVNGVNFFNESVLYYQVVSEKLKELHYQIVRTVYSTDQINCSKFELDHYVPHLTITKHKQGYEHLPLEEIAVEAKEVLQEKCMFTPRFVRIYRRDNSRENFKKLRDLYFKNL